MTAHTSVPALAVFRPAGDLDQLQAEDLRDAGLERLDGAGAALIIDLADVVQFDAAALSAMVRIRNAAIADGKSVVAVHARPSVYRVFAATGLTDAFRLTST